MVERVVVPVPKELSALADAALPGNHLSILAQAVVEEAQFAEGV